MSWDNDLVVDELVRQAEAGFPPCGCSNCNPQKAAILFRNVCLLTCENFQVALEDPTSLDPNSDYTSAGMKAADEERTLFLTKKRKAAGKTKAITDEPLLELSGELKETFKHVFDYVYEGEAPIEPENHFGDAHIAKIIEQVENINSEDDLRRAIGGEPLEGAIQKLYITLAAWRGDGRGESFFSEQAEKSARIEKTNQETRARLEARAKGMCGL